MELIDERNLGGCSKGGGRRMYAYGSLQPLRLLQQNYLQRVEQRELDTRNPRDENLAVTRMLNRASTL